MSATLTGFWRGSAEAPRRARNPSLVLLLQTINELIYKDPMPEDSESMHTEQVSSFTTELPGPGSAADHPTPLLAADLDTN